MPVPATEEPMPVPATEEPTPVPATEEPTPIPPTEEPTPVPATEEPVAAPATAPIDAPLDPQLQAAALLPDFQGDLSRAGAWNRYTINATIDPDARTIAGRERVEYTNRDTATLDRLYFHLYPNLRDFAGQLDITNLLVDGQVVAVAYEEQGYLLRVDLPQPLAPGATAAVAFDFATRAPRNASESFYGAFNREAGVLALASSYPITAIVRGGAWDIARIRDNNQGDFVNSETALYEVTLTAPADWSLVTTGAVVDGRLDGGRQTARIVSGPQRDFMISLTQLQHLAADVDGTRINSYYRSGHERGGQLALDSAVNSLRAFNARYGRYPLTELDIVEISASTFSGVEYPGVILMESGLYASGRGMELTIAHEVGHQWWYSLVGNDVQGAAWIDEALASYSQIVYQEQIHGPEAAERELEVFRRRYRDAAASGRDGVVEQPTSAFRRNYVALVYGKAVLFFQALREQIGEEAFDRFLHNYYATHRYGYVSGGDLLASAEGACGCELDELYHNWITTVTPVEVP
jgi:aminopeptidase N